MWNLKACNKILDQRTKQESHYRHLKALRNVKSSLNNNPPRKYSFLQSKQKAKQLLRQKNSQIDRVNTLLVNRMITMPSSLPATDDVFVKQSLNAPFVRKKERKIDEENVRIVRKLQGVGSKYSQRQINRSMHSYYQSRSNLAFSRMDPYYDMETLSKKNSHSSIINPNLKSRPWSAKK